MKRLLALAIFLSLGMAGVAWADAIPTNVDSTTAAVWTRVVFNDSGGSLTHGTVVVWDTDDTEFDRSGYPYVTTSTSSDSIYVAGVTTNDDCPDQSLCDIVVFGPTPTRISGAANGAAEDIYVGTSSTAGEADDYDEAASSCALGILLENRSTVTGALCTEHQDNCPAMVFVRPACSGPS